jgi:caspase-like apoptosis-related cysteine protease
MAIIFNHKYFDYPSLRSRDGTNDDRDNLEHTLNVLGFQVTVHENLNREDLMKNVEQG